MEGAPAAATRMLQYYFQTDVAANHNMMRQIGDNRTLDRPLGEGNTFSIAGTMNQWSHNDKGGLCGQQALCPTDEQEGYHHAHGHQAVIRMTQANGMHAVRACIQQRHGSLRPLGEGNNFSFAGTELSRSVSIPCQLSTIRLPAPPHFIVTQPALLPGTRCYTDASHYA
jgi:hypothetical protein